MKPPVFINFAGRATGRPQKARLPSGEWTPYPAAEGQESHP
jgi:hypothetical protein